MGVKGFFNIKIINDKSVYNGKQIKDLAKPLKDKHLYKKVIMVDASIIIYKALLVLNQQLMNDYDNITSHINNVFSTVIWLALKGSKQIWVFDCYNRSELKTKRHHQIKEIAYHIEEIKILLCYMGIECIYACDGIEAEQLASYYCKNGMADFVLSSDSDVLMFGGNLLRINYDKNKSKGYRQKDGVIETYTYKKRKYEIFKIKNVLKHMGIFQVDLILICLCLGTDFNEKYPKIGAGTVMKKYDKVAPYPKPFLKTFRYLMRNIDDNIKTSKIIKNKYPKLDELKTFLNLKSFNMNKVNVKIDAYIKYIQNKEAIEKEKYIVKAQGQPTRIIQIKNGNIININTKDELI